MAIVAYHKRLHTRNKTRRIVNPSRRHGNLSEIQSVNCIFGLGRQPIDICHVVVILYYPVRPEVQSDQSRHPI